ncbi:MAG: amino acid adenylation domain-containing protein, partial [Crinalium sp.]
MDISKNTATNDHLDKCVHQLFEEQANRRPEHIAVIYKQQRLTYAELNSRANQLAQYLKIRGVDAETLVAICVERSLDLAVGILGIIKSGAAYLPLDPNYPKDRLTFMLADAQVPILVTQSHLAPEINYQQAQVICLDTDWQHISEQHQENYNNKLTADNLAYVIYTSGSTGKPKGVMLTHANLYHYVTALQVELKVQTDDIYLYIASMAFSSSRRQLLLPLTQGATVLIATEEERKDPFILSNLVKEQGVTVMDAVPSFWRTYTNVLLSLNLELRTNLLNNKLRLIISASEPLLSDIPKTWMCEFNHPAHHVHMFGQTETSGIVCLYHISKEYIEKEEKINVIPIGKPIANTQIYILDSEGQPVEVDKSGEIYIAGAGVGRGYLNQPELTAEKFIKNNAGICLYKTGDWGKYLPDGSISYLSRQDYLIKIRGFRVELSEIEAVLITHPSVKECVVNACEDVPGNKRLVAYIVPKQASAPAVKELRNFLQQQLPDYMVPSAFVMLDVLPFTPNG